MIAKLLLQNLIWVAGMGALLFVTAGTWHWPAAWLLLATMMILGLAGGLWFAKTDPALLAERMRPMMQEDQPAADKKFILVFGFTALLWVIVIGLDRRLSRCRHSDSCCCCLPSPSSSGSCGKIPLLCRL